MHGFLIRFIVTCLALGLTATIVPGIDIRASGPLGDMLAVAAAGLVLSVLNAFVRPILLLLTLPVTLLTLGLFIIVLNGLLFWLTSAIVKGFHVANFWAALIGTILVSIISAILNAMVRDRWER